MSTMADADKFIGTVLDGKYQILRLLGRGGMGEVYEATHLQLDRSVALKVIHGNFAENDSFMARFAREARATARIEHPNAVHVYDFGSLEGGGAYLVMEFIDGVSLRQVMRENERVGPSTALDLIRQAAGAVSAAHARGVVHRDLKPENMMVRAGEDGRPVLKVVDFGIAKMLENETSQLTNQSELIGTPRYMAPEQFAQAPIDERIDVYALGCILYELMTGRAPFEGTFIEVVGKHVYAEPPRVGDAGVEVPDAVEKFIRRALAKDPDDRIPSASRLVQEFEEALGSDAARTPTELITIPLASPHPNTSGMNLSQLSTNLAPGSRPLVDALATRVDEGGTEATRLRDTDPPTVFVPAEEARVAPYAPPDHETQLEEPRTTVMDAPRTSRSWRTPAAIGMAAILSVVGIAYWRPFAISPAEPQPAVSAPAAVPSIAPAEPAPVEAPETPGDVPAEPPAPAPEAATTGDAKPDAPAEPTKRRQTTRVESGRTGQAGEPSEPDVDVESDFGPDDEIDVNPDAPPPPGLTPAQRRKWREAMQRLKEMQKRRATQPRRSTRQTRRRP